MISRGLIALVAIAVVYAAPSSAQMNMPPYNTYPQNFYVPGLGDMDIQRAAEDARRDGVQPRSTLGARALDVVREGTRAPTRFVSLTFAPSQARRKANYARFVAQSRSVDPAGAAGLAETLKSDPIAQMAPELARDGLRTDNVADAYTVYWVEAWETVHGVTGETSRGTAEAVQRQASAALLATPEFANATDAQKQEFADALLVQALLIGAAREQAGGDAAKLREIANAVRQGARASGLDLDAMMLTEDGFVPAE